MKILLTILTLLSIQPLKSQEIEYDGIYRYGTTADSGRTSIIYVNQNSDSTLLFYLELNRGAPSYNSGAIVGQMTIIGPGEADFTMKNEGHNINCSMNFWFTNDSLYIRTNDQEDDCGYGYGVYSSGDFKKSGKEDLSFSLTGVVKNQGLTK